MSSGWARDPRPRRETTASIPSRTSRMYTVGVRAKRRNGLSGWLSCAPRGQGPEIYRGPGASRSEPVVDGRTGQRHGEPGISDAAVEGGCDFCEGVLADGYGRHCPHVLVWD